MVLTAWLCRTEIDTKVIDFCGFTQYIDICLKEKGKRKETPSTLPSKRQYSPNRNKLKRDESNRQTT